MYVAATHAGIMLTFWTRECQRPANLPLQTSTFVPQGLSVWGLAVRSSPRYLAASPGQRPYKPRGCWGWWLPLQYSPFRLFLGRKKNKNKTKKKKTTSEARLCRSNISVRCASILNPLFLKLLPISLVHITGQLFFFPPRLAHAQAAYRLDFLTCVRSTIDCKPPYRGGLQSMVLRYSPRFLPPILITYC